VPVLLRVPPGVTSTPLVDPLILEDAWLLEDDAGCSWGSEADRFAVSLIESEAIIPKLVSAIGLGTAGPLNDSEGPVKDFVSAKPPTRRAVACLLKVLPAPLDIIV